MGKNGGREPLLDLETDKPLPAVRIDGVDYPLRLNVAYPEMVAQRQRARKIIDLSNDERPELTEQEEAELGDLLAGSVGRMIDAPEDVLSKLTDLQRVAVTTTYYNEALEIMDPTGVNRGSSSRDSSDSTAEV